MEKMQQAQARLNAPIPFVQKTYEIVDNPENKDLIAWSAGGNSFIIKNTVEFARDLLPRHFKTNKFKSFKRQLNTYGFKRVDDYVSHEYQHDSFRSGDKRRLLEIQAVKKKSSPDKNVSNVQLAPTPSNTVEGQAVISSTSLPVDGALDPEIVLENKRLRQENAALKHELQRFRRRLDYVVGLMKDLAGAGPVRAVPQDQEAGGSGGNREDLDFFLLN